jgi:hypothetical protein
MMVTVDITIPFSIRWRLYWFRLSLIAKRRASERLLYPEDSTKLSSLSRRSVVRLKLITVMA